MYNKFSVVIFFVVMVFLGVVIDVYMQEVSVGQISCGDGFEVLVDFKFEFIYLFIGLVYVEGVEFGDVLKVIFYKVELQECGWNFILLGFGFFVDQFIEFYLCMYEMEFGDIYIVFSDKIKVFLNFFFGVMGVVLVMDEMFFIIFFCENGGNMDDLYMVEGIIIYFLVFVEGVLFFIGDVYVIQGMGEVCGIVIEVLMYIVYELEVFKGGCLIFELEYELDDFYVVMVIGMMVDEVVKKVVVFMVEYLVVEYGLGCNEVYVFCFLVGDLKIVEVVDVFNMLVVMYMFKDVFGIQGLIFWGCVVFSYRYSFGKFFNVIRLYFC